MSHNDHQHGHHDAGAHGHDHHNHHHHDHGHGGHDHEHGGHDHSDDVEPALQTLIWQQIEFEKIRTLNELELDSGAKIVEKSWPQRMNAEPELVSDTDEQMLMFVPFTGVLRLHSILIRTSASPSAPRTLKLYLNQDNLDFSTASDTTPTQTLILSQTSEIQEIPIKRALFGNTYSLTLFFEDNFGAFQAEEGEGEGEEKTRVSYLGFKGDWVKVSREKVEVLYEKAANPRDHIMTVGASAGGMLDAGGAGRDGM